MKSKLYYIGTAGLPATYGGFETLIEHLVENMDFVNVVFCSKYHFKNKNFRKEDDNQNYRRIWLPLAANGPCSLLYDALSLLIVSLRSKSTDKILIFGVSGAWILPIIKIINKSEIVVHLDGIEWKRGKWNKYTKILLYSLEYIAVKFSHKIISDNKEIFKYVLKKYEIYSYLIAYGSPNPISLKKDDLERENILHKEFFLSICRIVPENNIELILKAFSKSSKKIIFIGNWKSDSYSQKLYDKYHSFENITLLLPIYCPKRLNVYRTKCISYIHGHSVGGSNPSLIEIMSYKKPIIAYKCNFNLYTLNNLGLYFNCEQDLTNILKNFYKYNLNEIAEKTQIYARNNYTWEIVKEKYIKMLRNSI